jgi:hypothetical protein
MTVEEQLPRILVSKKENNGLLEIDDDAYFLLE